MEVDLELVRSIFRDVLANRMTREMADRWALSMVQQSEAGALIFAPEADRKRIWDGIMYLYGVDTLGGPGEYLHTDEDIRTAMQAKVGEI